MDHDRAARCHSPRRLARACRAAGPALLLLAGCATPDAPGSRSASCPMGERGLSIVLYFGATTADGRRMPADRWAAFEDRALQPLLPDGFTVLDAHGTWKNPKTGLVERDPTYVVQAVVRAGVDVRALVQAAADRFKEANPAQAAIGAVVEDVCSDFDVEAAAAAR
jgi:hypothetical protein